MRCAEPGLERGWVTDSQCGGGGSGRRSRVGWLGLRGIGSIACSWHVVVGAAGAGGRGVRQTRRSPVQVGMCGGAAGVRWGGFLTARPPTTALGMVDRPWPDQLVELFVRLGCHWPCTSIGFRPFPPLLLGPAAAPGRSNRARGVGVCSGRCGTLREGGVPRCCARRAAGLQGCCAVAASWPQAPVLLRGSEENVTGAARGRGVPGPSTLWCVAVPERLGGAYTFPI